MAAVMIGVDPHKGSHTAVVIGVAEEPLGEIRVRAPAAQTGKLVAWAAAWPERTWAVEGAGVQPKLASRVRLLQAGDTNKNDPSDALSVAVAAPRSRTARQVTAEDYSAVLKVWSKRHRDLGRLRNQVACRLHAVLCDLVPGGHSKEISAAQAARILEQATPSGAVAVARAELAAEFPEDMRRLDARLRDTRKKLAAAVRACGTTLTNVFGAGPWSPAPSSVMPPRCPASPAVIISPPITAPPRPGCPPGTGRYTGCRCAATGELTTRSTWSRSPRSGTGMAAGLDCHARSNACRPDGSLL
jgi:transposase